MEQTQTQTKTNTYSKDYYAKNKESILQKMKKNVVCEDCGRTYQHTYQAKHKQSKVCREARRLNEANNNIKIVKLQNDLREAFANINELLKKEE